MTFVIPKSSINSLQLVFFPPWTPFPFPAWEPAL
jgi:hypothetical protein